MKGKWLLTSHKAEQVQIFHPAMLRCLGLGYFLVGLHRYSARGHLQRGKEIFRLFPDQTGEVGWTGALGLVCATHTSKILMLQELNDAIHANARRGRAE